MCQGEDTTGDLESYSKVASFADVDGCQRCHALKQDVKSLNASLVAKTRVIEEFQDRCHTLNTTAALGAQGGGGRGITRGGGDGHRGDQGGGGVARGGRYALNVLVLQLRSLIFRVVGGEN